MVDSPKILVGSYLTDETVFYPNINEDASVLSSTAEYISQGSLIISKTNDNYSLSFDITLEGDKKITGKYEGISTEYIDEENYGGYLNNEGETSNIINISLYETTDYDYCY